MNSELVSVSSFSFLAPSCERLIPCISGASSVGIGVRNSVCAGRRGRGVDLFDILRELTGVGVVVEFEGLGDVVSSDISHSC